MVHPAPCADAEGATLQRPRRKDRIDNLLRDQEALLLHALAGLLPALRTGEAIIAGEAARLPVRCRVTLPSEAHLPRSADPAVTVAWATRRTAEGYDRVVASWRAQSTTAVAVATNVQRQAVEPDAEAEG